MSVARWVDRWIGMGIGELYSYCGDDLDAYRNRPMVSMPRSDAEICDILHFMEFRLYESLRYPKEHALPMIELMQVGI